MALSRIDADQRRPAAGDQAVDGVPLLHELDRRLAAGVLDQHERVLGQAGLGVAPRAARAAMAMLDEIAPDEPRRKAALPDLRHRPAASLVTLGRFS